MPAFLAPAVGSRGTNFASKTNTQMKFVKNHGCSGSFVYDMFRKNRITPAEFRRFREELL